MEKKNTSNKPRLDPKPTTKRPSFRTMTKWVTETGIARATDGCKVEPDGYCKHGYPSWIIELGF